MNEEEFGKKIASYLNEIPLDKSIENKLMHARTNALLKRNEQNFVSMNKIVALKPYNWLIIGVLASLLFFSMLLHNSIVNFIYPSEEISLSSSDFEDFLSTSYEKNKEFILWDNEIDTLLK